MSVGGKAKKLMELSAAGFPVPKLAALDGDDFGKFLGGRRDEFCRALLSRQSQVLCDIILGTDFERGFLEKIAGLAGSLGAPLVAVRSTVADEDGAKHSFAGIHESYLNVQIQDAAEAVRKVWCSYYSDRAFSYRAKYRLEPAMDAGVLLQAMVMPDIAGVCFTANPVNQNRNEIMIEAVWGLGVGLVSGEIIPDTITVDAPSMTVKNYILSEQDTLAIQNNDVVQYIPVDPQKREERKLSGEDIVLLSRICKKIESHYSWPQDIEWAFSGGRLFILQARPVTTLKPA